MDGFFAVFTGVASFKLFSHWWALVLEGIAGIVIGTLTFFYPNITAIVLLYLIAAWAFITGIFKIVAAIQLRREITGEWMLILGGLASIIFSVLLVIFPGVDAANVLVFNSNEETLEFAASRDFTTDALRYTRLKFGEGFAGRAAADKQRIHIPDLKSHDTDFFRSASFIAEGFVAYYAIPLVSRNQVKGVLEVFHRSPFECS